MASTVVTSDNVAEFNAANVKYYPPKEEAPPKAEEKPEAKAAEDKQEAAEEEHDEEQQPKKTGLQKRFSELTQARDRAKQEAREAREEAERVRKELEDIRKAAEPPRAKNAKPEPKDYNDPFAYAEALAEWRVAESMRERDAREAARAAEERAQAVARDWEKRAKAVAKEIEDYEDVIAEADIRVTNELRDAILESEIGPRIQYYLAKNPDEVERLQAMTVAGMLRSFGRLEAKLEAGLEKDKPAARAEPKRQVKEAPEPITPIKGASATGSHVVDSDGNVTGSFAAYKAARKAGKLR